MKNYKEDIQTAEMQRALELVEHEWSTNEVSVDDMCAHLNAIGDMVDGASFEDFAETTNLSDRKRLN